MNELFNVFIDRTKMELVSDLIELQPNLNTIILDPKVVYFPIDFIEPWLWKLNSLKLRFLRAEDVGDITNAFRRMDDNGDGRISIDELNQMAGIGTARYWSYKYGKDYTIPRHKDMKNISH